MKHAVVIGDPAYFRIKAGKNPYTRTRWGFKKKVDLTAAIAQWQNFKLALEKLGVRVFVLPASRENPSMVFPANAGFLFPKYEPLAWTEKRFYVSRLSPHRKAEAVVYTEFFSGLGFSVDTLPYDFEGEADFFPCDDFYIFSYGKIVPTGFRPVVGWLPYRYQFSHRSDRRNKETLQKIVGNREIIEVYLTDERYYHGDTVMFALGVRREYLLAYRAAMDSASWDRLKRHLGSHLIELSREDAENFAANSFQADTPLGPHIIFPSGISGDLKEKVSSLGFSFTLVDVSEFFKKGGGSVKCMLCDLGPLPIQK